MNFPQQLVDGYSAFYTTRLRVEQERFRQLAESGQRPQTMVIGCADSRVSPEVIFDARPGELFVVRNVANLVPPYAPDGHEHGISAALEFAVQALKVQHIVVLGHARCGGINAFAEQNVALSSGDFIGKWVSLIKPAADAVGPRGQRDLAGYLCLLEQTSIIKTLDNLLTFPWISALVQNQELHLHAAYFDVANGQLSIGNRETGVFAALRGARA